jgi:hypothetical protein
MGRDMIENEADNYVKPAPDTPMKVYLLTQDINISPKAFSYCLVVAPSGVEARYIHPYQNGNLYWSGDSWISDVWVRLEDTHLIEVIEIGNALPNQRSRAVLCA